MQRLPVLIDTDIGDDVDDAFALALAARLPTLQLCGVTTVCGPVEARARLVATILAAAGGVGVPVVAGESAMSDGRPGSARFSHHLISAAAVNGERAGGLELLLRLSHERTPLTIIALGPLTNIAAALERDPSLARRARLVAMAGKQGVPYPDWNLRCDPQAARRVLAAGMPVALVGMQLTLRSKLWPQQLQRLFADQRPLARILGRCVLAWRTWKRRVPFLHDALTVAAAAQPALFAWERRKLLVGPRGFSRALPLLPTNALVATRADIAGFHALLNQYLFEMPALPQTTGWLERLAHWVA